MKNTITRQFLTAIVIIAVIVALMLCYIFTSFYVSATEGIGIEGISNVNGKAAEAADNLNRAYSVLSVTADTVDNMLQKGDTSESIAEYITLITKHTQTDAESGFRSIYGIIDDKYIDGSTWMPPKDYTPVTREWYKAAISAKGSPTLAEPYIDAETGDMIISVSKMLADGKSVLSMDIELTKMQNIVNTAVANNMSAAFIVSESGIVIAHTNVEDIGKNYSDMPEYTAIMENMTKENSGRFPFTYKGRNYTVFSKDILNKWHIVTVGSNDKLYAHLRSQIGTGILISVMVYGIIIAFSVITAKKLNKIQMAELASQKKLDKVNLNIIRSLAYTIDAKDRYTSGHSQRVAEYSLEIAKRMGMSKEDRKIVYFAGLLHDVGKIRVPGAIINKPGKLTDEEFDQIRVHPVSGYHILKGIHEDERIGYGAKYHHERYDGKGYPNGLAGENIPEIARIIGVADAYDAMASNRSYRGALPQEAVRREIEKGKGKQFDPKIADIMLELIDADKEYKMCQLDDIRRNVLVIDDEPMNIKIVEHILKDVSNINVIGAINAKESFDVLEKNEVSLIMLDLKMPDIDGFELYEQIHEKYPVPVTVLTSDRSIETIQRINDLGISDYLTKPLNTFVTKETVYGVINERKKRL